MFKSLKKNFFPFIIAFSALSISASAAFYSVSGLSKLFAGAQLEVIIMAGSLEFGKLVIASLLYQYWDTINKWLRTYLTIAAVILVLITSMGIYGFLSAAYQETYQKLVVQQNQIEFLDNKAQFYEADVTRYDEELERISNNIATLSNARSQQIQVRDTTVAGGVRTTISTSELRLAQSRINVEEENRRSVQAKREVAADSLQTIKLKILDLQNESDTVGELGPLQYLSGLTGTPMDKIINILLLVIIFVFDPLAISMVVAANFAFDMANPKRKEDEETPYDPTLTDDFEDDDDYYDNRGSIYYDDEDEYAEDTILDKPAEKAKKPPLDIQAEPTEEAQAWYDIADKLKEAAVDMDEDQILEEEFGHLKDWVDIKEEQMQDTAFMDFQRKMDENDAELEAAEEEIEAAEEELDEFEKEVEEWKNRKWEVENTAGDVAVIDPEEDNSDKTEMESDRTGTFPNENNPTSVGAVVQKIDTPHLPQEEKPAPNVIKPRALPPEARGVEPPVEKVKEVDEDELFDAAMRKKAEEDMKDFLNKRDGKQN